MGIFNEAKIIWASGQHFNQWVCIKSKFVAKNSAKTAESSAGCGLPECLRMPEIKIFQPLPGLQLSRHNRFPEGYQ